MCENSSTCIKALNDVNYHAFIGLECYGFSCEGILAAKMVNALSVPFQFKLSNFFIDTCNTCMYEFFR